MVVEEERRGDPLEDGNGRIETSPSSRASSKGVQRQERRSGEGGKHGNSGLDGSRVVCPERRDDGVISEKELTRNSERLNVEAGRRAGRGCREHVRL